MYQFLHIVLLSFFTGTLTLTSYAQRADPPQWTHNLSQERLKSKFKLSKKKFQKRIDFTKIDTNAIYIRPQTYDWKRNDTVYVFMRFFKDAVFESGSYIHPPTDEEAEDLTYGSWRCYTFDKKTGMIVIEVPMPFMMSSRWMYHWGTVSEDTLKITKYSGSYPNANPGKHTPGDAYKRPVAFKNRAHVWMPATKEDL